MANTLITPKIVAREATMVLMNNAVGFPLMRNLSHQAEFTGTEKVGETVKIRVPAPADVRDFTGTATSRDLVETSTDLTIEKHFYDQIKVSQKDWTLELRDFNVQVLSPIMKQFAEKLSTYCLSKVSLVGHHTGTPGDPPDSVEDVNEIGRIMSTNKVPLLNRVSILDPFAAADWKNIKTSHEADKRGDGGLALRRSSMGDIYGFDWFEDQSVNRHTNGTPFYGPTAAVNVGGGVLVDATTMDMDAGTGSGVIVPGDLFTVVRVGQPDFTGVFTNDKTATTGAITGAGFSPPAPEGGLADDAVITILVSHTKNVAFGLGAFTAVAFPPLAAQGTTSASFFDDTIGLGINVTFGYDNTSLSDVISFQLLAGAALQQEDLAVVIVG